MKRKLLRQIINEWPANIWLAVELLIVSVVMWYLTDIAWVTTATYTEPLGFDISHCYLVHMEELDEKSPDYKPYPDLETSIEDRLTAVRRIEARPEVEAVGLGQTSYFYNNSNSGTRVAVDTLDANGWILQRLVSPGFFKVFRIYGSDGETPEEMAEAFEKMNLGQFMAAEDLFHFKYHMFSLKDYIGRKFAVGLANSDSLELVKTYKRLRYSDFMSGHNNLSSVILQLPYKQIAWANETVVRVKDNMDKDFIENLMADALGELRVGNWYISSVEPFDEIRRQYQIENTQQVINVSVTSAFLLLNIFLGVLGTFWFRTSQRTSEIALRMANGASRLAVFRRVISEGEVILLAVTPIAAVLDYVLVHFELNRYYMFGFWEPVRFFGCVAITWALLALMIAVGSLFPALRAMKVSPAEALKTE